MTLKVFTYYINRLLSSFNITNMLQGQVIVISAIHSKIPEQQDSGGGRVRVFYIYHGPVLREKSYRVVAFP